MNLLTVENMTKSYTERFLFHKVSFSINENEKIGLIGINGTGKSTLLKIVAGLEVPEEGCVTKGNTVEIRYLPQNPIFEKGITVLEAVLKDDKNTHNQWTIESEGKAILNKLGFSDYDEKIDFLSGGQKKRVALAKTILYPADILILDEPTNHLDNEMATWLEEYLNKYNGAILMVTHDRYFLDRVSNKIVEIDKANIYTYPGNYSEYLKLKEAREDMELASERKRQSILRTELEWISRGARARSTKQRARIERYEELKNRKGPAMLETVEMTSVSSRLGKQTLELNNIYKSYNDKQLISDFSYIFLRNDRIGIIGKNGTGKTTLLKIINGIVEPDSGSVTMGQTVKIGYFSQENEYMDESLRVIDYIRNIAEFVKTVDGSISASQMLERFLFEGSMQYTQISRLSGGEKRRLYLLRVLMEAPNILILDEPTNDLDIYTLRILEDYLSGFDGIVITVSHDRYFLDRVVDRIFAFEEEGRVKQYEGSFSDYLTAFQRDQEEVNNLKERFAPKTTKVTATKEKKSKFTFKEQRDFDTIEADISALEEKIEELDNQIEASASNYGALTEFMKEKEHAEIKLEEKMERWMYLSELAEKIQQERKNS